MPGRGCSRGLRKTALAESHLHLCSRGEAAQGLTGVGEPVITFPLASVQVVSARAQNSTPRFSVWHLTPFGPSESPAGLKHPEPEIVERKIAK
jgi:hypothetical protein